MMDIMSILREPSRCLPIWTGVDWGRACGCDPGTMRCARVCLRGKCGEDVGVNVDEVARKLEVDVDTSAHVVTAIMAYMGTVNMWLGSKQCIVDVSGNAVVVRCGETVEVVCQEHVEAFSIQDPVLNVNYFVIMTHHGMYGSDSIDEAVDLFLYRDRAPKYMNRQLWLNVIGAVAGARAVLYPLYSGPYPRSFNGSYWVVGVMEYPAVNFDCDPEAMNGLIEWVNKTYDANKTPAYANLGILVGKVYAPAVRMTHPFLDYAVLNSGWTGIGKTTLMQSIVNALGLMNTGNTLVIGEVGDATEAGLRDVLSQSMAPLIMSDMKADAVLPKLSNFALAFTSFVSGMYIKHEKHTYFPARTPVMVTNLTPTRAAELLGITGPHPNTGAARKFRFIEWEPAPLPRGVYPYEPRTEKRFIGCLKDLWNGNGELRDKALKTQDLVELSILTWDYVAKEYGIDAKPITEALQWLRNEWDEQFMEFMGGRRDAVDLRNNLYGRARSTFNATNMTPTRLARMVLEDPGAFGVKFYRPRELTNEAWEKAMQELRVLAASLGVDIEKLPTPPYQRDEDAIIALLHNYLTAGYTRVIIYCRGPNAILSKCPHEFMGSVISTYVEEGVKVRGYSLDAVQFIRLIIEGSSTIDIGQGNA